MSVVFSGEQLLWLLLVSIFSDSGDVSFSHGYRFSLWRFLVAVFSMAFPTIYFFSIVYNSDMTCLTQQTQIEMTCNMVLLFSFLDGV